MTDVAETTPRLSDHERGARFARLQQRLVPVWGALRLNQPGESIVVVPSVAPDSTQSGAVVQALEERMLFLLLLPREPRLRVIYLTGRPVPDSIVDHYLGLLVDLVVVRDDQGTWTPYAIELNLCKGGTTHPFLTLQFLTDGKYDPATALFTAPTGREKHLMATDHLESEFLRGLTIDDLFDIAVRNRLHFDQARQTGTVFHVMSTFTELGRVGLTAVGDSREQAHATFRRAERVVLEEAGPPPEPALPAL